MAKMTTTTTPSTPVPVRAPLAPPPIVTRTVQAETPTVQYVPVSGRSRSRVIVNNHFHMGMVRALVRNPSATILLLHKGSNPREPGTDTHHNWRFYEKEMTFAAYVKNPDYVGGERKALDTLLWDLRRGFITVTNVPDNVMDVITSMPKLERGGFGRY